MNLTPETVCGAKQDVHMIYQILKVTWCSVWSYILYAMVPKFRSLVQDYTPVSCWAQPVLHLHIGHVPCRCNHG